MKKIYKICMSSADIILGCIFVWAVYRLLRYNTPMLVTAQGLLPFLRYVITLSLVLHLCKIKDISPPVRSLRDRFLFGWEFAVETCGNFAILCVLSCMYVSFSRGMENAQLQLAQDSVRLWAFMALVGLLLPEREPPEETDVREQQVSVSTEASE